MSELRFTTDEVAAISGATYRQIDSWVRLGKLAPSARGTGTGKPRVFSSSDAAKAVAMTALIKDMGATPRVADVILTDHHRKGWCVAEFGPVTVRIDMREARDRVKQWVEANR